MVSGCVGCATSPVIAYMQAIELFGVPMDDTISFLMGKTEDLLTLENPANRIIQ